MNIRRLGHEVAVRGLGLAQPIRIAERVGFFKEGGKLNILRDLTRNGFQGRLQDSRLVFVLRHQILTISRRGAF